MVFKVENNTQINKSMDLFSGIDRGNPRIKAICLNLIEQNEKLSEYIYFAIVKVSSPYLVLPKFLYSFYIYFTNGYENDAFLLPIPSW